MYSCGSKLVDYKDIINTAKNVPGPSQTKFLILSYFTQAECIRQLFYPNYLFLISFHLLLKISPLLDCLVTTKKILQTFIHFQKKSLHEIAIRPTTIAKIVFFLIF